MALSLEEKLDISVSMGAPVDGIIKKLEHIGPKLDYIIHEVCEGPREFWVLMTLYCLTNIIAGTDDEPFKAVEKYADQLPGFTVLLQELLAAKER